MALKIGSASVGAAPSIHPTLKSCPTPLNFIGPKHYHHSHLFFKLWTSSSSSAANHLSSSSSFKAAADAQSERLGDGEITEQQDEETLSFTVESLSSTRTQLDLLEQLTSTSSSSDGYVSEEESCRPSTIREQLYQLVGNREGENFTIPLGKKNLKKVSANFLTISQKRNIKRQAYLNNVSKRNDSSFFATIAAFVILPPILILGMAILTGFVQLFP